MFFEAGKSQSSNLNNPVYSENPTQNTLTSKTPDAPEPHYADEKGSCNLESMP